MKQFLFILSRVFLPTWLILRLGNLKIPILGWESRRLLTKRNVTLKHGIGRGLKFNPGGYHIDTAIGTYELPVQMALQKYLHSGDVFYDIGANVGFFSVIGAKLIGKTGKVYAFEPDPENAAKLRHNLKINHQENVQILEKAVFESSGQSELVLAQYPGSRTLSTSTKVLNQNYVSRPHITIKTVSLDDLLNQEQLLPPDIIKIDIEGTEFEALQGMTQTLNKICPILIYEVDGKSETVLNERKILINEFVRQKGYTIEELEDWYPQRTHFVKHYIALPDKNSDN